MAVYSYFWCLIMGRIIAIDYGKKRVGIAVTDTLQLIANGLTTVASHEVIAFLERYIQTEPVDKIIIGLPKQMNNELSESMKYITPFVHTLKKSLKNILKRICSYLILMWFQKEKPMKHLIIKESGRITADVIQPFLLRLGERSFTD